MSLTSFKVFLIFFIPGIQSFTSFNTKSGRILNIDDMYITMKGIEYLQDNSKMKQVYSVLKEVKDWIPGM